MSTLRKKVRLGSNTTHTLDKVVDQDKVIQRAGRAILQIPQAQQLSAHRDARVCRGTKSPKRLMCRAIRVTATTCCSVEKVTRKLSNAHTPVQVRKNLVKDDLTTAAKVAELQAGHCFGERALKDEKNRREGAYAA